MAIHKSIRIHQYLDDCVGESQIPPGLSPAHSKSSENMPRIRLAGEFGQVRTGSKAGFQFDVKAGRVRPTPDRWQTLQDKILEILSLPACPVRQFMPLIGFLTATEKQVHRGRLHMRPIQWHLKNNWRIPESLEKVIPIPRSLLLIYNGGYRKTTFSQANHYTQ